MGAYIACAAELAVDADVRLTRLWCVCDGRPDHQSGRGPHQLEGGMIMAASWALKEQVKLSGAGISSLTWDDYPILRFSEVPPVEIELLNTTAPRRSAWAR